MLTKGILKAEKIRKKEKRKYFWKNPLEISDSHQYKVKIVPKSHF